MCSPQMQNHPDLWILTLLLMRILIKALLLIQIQIKALLLKWVRIQTKLSESGSRQNDKEPE